MEVICKNDDLGFIFGVAVSGSYAYLANYSHGLVVVDISTPSSPFVMTDVDMPGGSRYVTLAGDYFYVANSISGLYVAMRLCQP